MADHCGRREKERHFSPRRSLPSHQHPGVKIKHESLLGEGGEEVGEVERKSEFHPPVCLHHWKQGCGKQVLGATSSQEKGLQSVWLDARVENHCAFLHARPPEQMQGVTHLSPHVDYTGLRRPPRRPSACVSPHEAAPSTHEHTPHAEGPSPHTMPGLGCREEEGEIGKHTFSQVLSLV